MTGPAQNLWRTAVRNDPDHARRYATRWTRLAAAGHDLDGEARLVDAMTARGSRILDAGCGTGRVGGYLAARGHHVVGVDLDPHLIGVARTDHPGARWEVGDLATFALTTVDGAPLQFDLAVCAGNVVAFLAGSERVPALQRIRAHLAPAGRLVVGFSTERDYPERAFTADAEAAGLEVTQRFGSWELHSFDGSFLVAVLQRG
ncbi:MAG: class I SAM-dependent methyltransferase [Brachybacterium sp.]|nr:class I SAM-dependent methyltransferase [Brachybacterium sp.]